MHTARVCFEEQHCKKSSSMSLVRCQNRSIIGTAIEQFKTDQNWNSKQHARRHAHPYFEILLKTNFKTLCLLVESSNP